MDVIFEMWNKDNGKKPPELPKWIDMCKKFGKAFIDELFLFKGEEEYEDLMFRRCMMFKEFRASCHIVAPRADSAIQKKDPDGFCTALWEVSQKRAWDLKSPGVDSNPYADEPGAGNDDQHRQDYHDNYHSTNKHRWGRLSDP